MNHSRGAQESREGVLDLRPWRSRYGVCMPVHLPEIQRRGAHAALGARGAHPVYFGADSLRCLRNIRHKVVPRALLER
jgi:hypothetical protein